MKTIYQKSMQMIKILNIKTKRQYNRLRRDYFLLSSTSLKYITQTKDFQEIIRMAKES